MQKQALAILAMGLFVVGCTGGAAKTEGGSAGATPTKAGESPKAEPAKVTGLKKEDTVVGTGDAAAEGDTVFMRYTGKLADGTVFDSNTDGEKPPFSFILGAGSVIKGWDEGIPGMKKGGKRTLSIPPELGYGAAGSGDKIPANAELFFDVEMLEVIKKGDEVTVTVEDKKPGTGPEIKKGDRVRIEYVLSELGGKELDNSANYKNKYYEFKVGAGEAIPGLDLAVEGMKAGGERFARVPPSLGPPPSPQSGPMGMNAYTTITIKILKVTPGKGK